MNENYKNLLDEHKRILQKARSLIEYMLDRLTKEVREYEEIASKTEPEKLDEVLKQLGKKFIFTDKETATTILTKMVQLLLKIIPLEQELATIDPDKINEDDIENIEAKNELTEADLKILENYMERKRELQNLVV